MRCMQSFKQVTAYDIALSYQVLQSYFDDKFDIVINCAPARNLTALLERLVFSANYMLKVQLATAIKIFFVGYLLTKNLSLKMLKKNHKETSKPSKHVITVLSLLNCRIYSR